MIEHSTLDERREFIMNVLESRARLTTAELSAHFRISEDTARRDFRELAAEGMIKRVHGAALKVTPAIQPFAARYKIALGAKSRLAQEAASLVSSGQVILVDGGTSNLELARKLPRDISFSVVTNSPPVALALSEHAFVEVVLLGGVFEKRSQMTLGARVIEAVRSINADLCFIGVHGIDAEIGLTTNGFDEAAVKLAMIEASAEVAAIATSDKIGTSGSYVVGPCRLVTTLIAQIGANEEGLSRIEQQGTRVVRLKV